MPFQTTNIEPRMNPLVTVTFAGLMVLRPGPNNTCEVGIHRFNTSHEIRVTLIIRKPDRQPTLVSLLQGPLEDEFTISHVPDPDLSMGRFAVFAPTPDFKRDDTTDHELDYRWAVNVADHHPGVDLNSGAQPLVRLRTGTLYTPHRTIEDLHPVLERGRTALDPPTDVIQLNRIASSLAAAITTPDDGTVVQLAWRDFGGRDTLTLPRPKDPEDTTYTVAFTNEPPKLKGEAHNEMTLYYRILESGTGFAVGSAQQFTLEYPASGARTDEVPCLAVTKNP